MEFQTLINSVHRVALHYFAVVPVKVYSLNIFSNILLSTFWIVLFTDSAYTVTDIIRMEVKILEGIEFNLGRPLPIHFLR